MDDDAGINVVVKSECGKSLVDVFYGLVVKEILRRVHVLGPTPRVHLDKAGQPNTLFDG